MAKDFDPRKFQAYFEKAAETNVKAFEAQTRYFQNLLKRNATLMSEMTSSRVSRLKDLATSRDISTAIKSTSETNQETREKMQALYEENMAAWEELQAELKELYAIDNDLIKKMQKSGKDMLDSAKSKFKEMGPKVKTAVAKPTAKKPAAKKPAPRKAPVKKTPG